MTRRLKPNRATVAAPADRREAAIQYRSSFLLLALAAVLLVSAGCKTMCNVSGAVKLDPQDHTNGYLNYKGTVTFTANASLTGTNLSLVGPKYLCYCSGCPTGSWYSTGFQPGSAFQPNESRTYTVVCGSSPQPLSGPVGKGLIQYFTGNQQTGYTDHGAACAGTFTFSN
jgi:hypothetical protein